MEQFSLCDILRLPLRTGDNYMNRNNGLYFVIGALVIAVIGLGVYVYQEESKPDGVQLSIGRDGIAIEEK